MKRIVLILTILGCLTSDSARAQNDAGGDDEEKLHYNSLRSFVSVMPGFQIFKKDAGYVTVAMPIGVNFRHYYEKAPNIFYDVDLAFMPVILEQKLFTSYVKVSVGAGVIEQRYNLQLHANYAHSFVYKEGNMVGIGYDVEAQSIPITIDVYKFLNNANYLLLLGIKVPLPGLHIR